MSEVRVKVEADIPESEVRRAVLATLVRRFDVEPNIRRADVEEHRGWIVCEIDGEAAQVEAALEWLPPRADHGGPARGRARELSRSRRAVSGRGRSGERCQPAWETLRGS